MDRGECRGCGASIRWAVMKSGKRNPVNPERDRERGNILICNDETDAALHGVELGVAVTLGPDQAAAEREQGTPLYLSHFATCPKRGQFGKKARAKR